MSKPRLAQGKHVSIDHDTRSNPLDVKVSSHFYVVPLWSLDYLPFCSAAFRSHLFWLLWRRIQRKLRLPLEELNFFRTRARTLTTQYSRGVLQENWGRAFPLPKTITLFMTKICDIRYPIYDLTKNSKHNLWTSFVDFLFDNDENVASS